MRKKTLMTIGVLLALGLIGGFVSRWCIGSRVITFAGSVEEGQTFSRRFESDFEFRLEPYLGGWGVSVFREDPRVDLTRLTTPFHGMNHRFIEGWHFRNRDNSGPNATGPLNVNAPGRLRTFNFAPHITASTPTTGEESRRAAAVGRGVLEIAGYTLTPCTAGERARMTSMDFEVRLEVQSRALLANRLRRCIGPILRALSPR